MIQFIPALDLVNGEVVRLYKGDLSRKEVYYKDVHQAIELFAKNKISYAHIVDLDGAIGDKPQRNLFDDIAAVIKNRFTFQWAGGIRTPEYAEYLLNYGAERIVVSTKAFLDKGFISAVLTKFPGRVAISLDVQENSLKLKGWKEAVPASDIPLKLREFIEQGCKHFIITDVSSDGTLAGARIDFFAGIMKGVEASFYIAGGISSEADLVRIRDARLPFLKGVIVGKALYEGFISLERAQKVLDGVI